MTYKEIEPNLEVTNYWIDNFEKQLQELIECKTISQVLKDKFYIPNIKRTLHRLYLDREKCEKNNDNM